MGRDGRRRIGAARSQRSSRIPSHQVGVAIAAELPDRIDELAHCTMTLTKSDHQAVLKLVRDTAESEQNTSQQRAWCLRYHSPEQICNLVEPDKEDQNLDREGRSGKLAVEQDRHIVFAMTNASCLTHSTTGVNGRPVPHRTHREGNRVLPRGTSPRNA